MAVLAGFICRRTLVQIQPLQLRKSVVMQTMQTIVLNRLYHVVNGERKVIEIEVDDDFPAEEIKAKAIAAAKRLIDVFGKEKG